MKYWETNSAVLREKFPGLLEQITAEVYPADVCVTVTASGAPSLTIKGLHVHSPRDPVREAQRLVEHLGERCGENPVEKSPVLILGFGLGYVAEAAAEKVGNRPIIIAEAQGGLLKKALETRDLRAFLADHRLIFVVGGSGDGIIGALQFCSSKKSETPTLIRNRTLMKLDEDWYARVEQQIRVWVAKDEVNSATLKRFGKRWVRNLARNMTAARDIPGIERLKGILAPSIPVLLAAAGPSLDRIIPALPELYRRCVIVAVDTSLRLLLKAGVEPDFAVSVDPQYWNGRHLDRCPAPRTCLIAESAVYPPVLRHPFARTFLCASLFPLGRFIEDRLEPKGRLGAGGSVATTAWDFARVLGGPSIWIAGLDLSYPGLKTHFKGALFEDRALAESTRMNPLETWSVRALRDGSPFRARSAAGETVLTDRRLSLYAAWFENRVQSTPEPRTYRLSDEGIAIQGLPSASIEALLSLPVCRAEIDQRLQGAFARTDADFGNPSQRGQRNRQYHEAVQDLLEGLEQLTDWAEGAAEAAERGYRYKTPAEQQRVLKKLDETNRHIRESRVKEVGGFLFPPAAELEANLPPPEAGLNRKSGGETSKGDDGALFLRYLEASAAVYRPLAEAAGYTLRVLRSFQGEGSA